MDFSHFTGLCLLQLTQNISAYTKWTIVRPGDDLRACTVGRHGGPAEEVGVGRRWEGGGLASLAPPAGGSLPSFFPPGSPSRWPQGSLIPLPSRAAFELRQEAQRSSFNKTQRAVLWQCQDSLGARRLRLARKGRVRLRL